LKGNQGKKRTGIGQAVKFGDAKSAHASMRPISLQCSAPRPKVPINTDVPDFHLYLVSQI
jgi:hypothetical protein